jgi:rubrerythrin
MGASHALPAAAPAHARAREDAVVCDRCATAMFRMHAVWRCPACGYKTDCCGW